MARRAGLLGALATAGISALAYEHEVKKQLNLLKEISDTLEEIRIADPRVREQVREMAERLNEWIERAQGTRALFSHLMDEENRDIEDRFRARPLVERVKDQVRLLTRGLAIETTDIDESLRLPKGTFAQWSAIFQNVFLNAANAMLDSAKKTISVSSEMHGRRYRVVVQDTGVGVDLASSEELFKPFVRKLKISQERRSLGFGGTGLGLTIVRMIAGTLGCNVKFIEPKTGFSTAFELSWSEAK